MRITLYLLLFLIATSCRQQDLAQVTVSAGQYDRIHSLMELSYSDPLPDQQGFWLENGDEKIPVYFLPGDNRLFWIQENLPAGQERTYFLIYETDSHPEGTMLRKNEAGLIMGEEDQRIMQYFAETLPAPEGTSELYARSGFIHPLFAPSGESLTLVQPEDHYHHVGIWNPWTHTLIGQDTVDFWNLAKGHGTVRSAGVQSYFNGDLAAGFTAHHEHVVFMENMESVVLEEQWNIICWSAPGLNFIDFESVMKPATSIPFHILAYSYQGFGYRGTAEWNENNISMLTSQGHGQADANTSRADWIMISGPVASEQAGVYFAGHPDNHNAPQTLRVWPPGSNGGVENIFINFNPAQDEDWVLKPGDTYKLRYRIVSFDEMSPEEAEKTWSAYSEPAQISIDYR